MTSRERADLDRHITGNYGEDQFENLGASAAPESPPTGLQALSDSELGEMLERYAKYFDDGGVFDAVADHCAEAARRLRSHEDSVMQAWYAGFDFANQTRKEE